MIKKIIKPKQTKRFNNDKTSIPYGVRFNSVQIKRLYYIYIYQMEIHENTLEQTWI